MIFNDFNQNVPVIILSEKKNDIFGYHKVCQNKHTKEKMILVERILKLVEYVNIKESINSLKKLKHPNMLKILDIQMKEFKNNEFLLRIFYEYPEISLKEHNEISKTTLQNESQNLTHFLYNLLSILAYLEEKKIVHGKVNPESIFFYSKQKSFKLLVIPDYKKSVENNHYQKIINNKDVYCSPVIYKSIKINKLKFIQHSPFKSDLFSLGLCILETGIKNTIQEIFGKYSIEQNILENYLYKFENNFKENSLLFLSLKKMLLLEELKRPSPSTLLNALPSYENICNYFEEQRTSSIKINTPQKILRVKDALLDNVMTLSRNSNNSKIEITEQKKNSYQSSLENHSFYHVSNNNRNLSEDRRYSCQTPAKNSFLPSPDKNQFKSDREQKYSLNYNSLNLNDNYSFGELRIMNGKLFREIKPNSKEVFILRKNNNINNTPIKERKNNSNFYMYNEYKSKSTDRPSSILTKKVF